MKITLEKHFQSMFGKWFETNGWTMAYELKISHGNTVAFSKFEEQQLPSLYKTKNGTFHCKMTDASLGLKPYDGYGMVKEKAYVGIMFDVPKNQKEFFLIDIDTVMKIKKSGKKSITRENCLKFGLCRSFK